MRRKILIICSDVIGLRMAGPAIRCIEMANVLSLEFDITVAAPQINGADYDKFKLVIANTDIVKNHSAFADIIIFQGTALARFPFLKNVDAVLVSDLYCPVPLEYHQSSAMVDDELRIQTTINVSAEVANQLRFADHFLCASDRQRDFWMGALAISGRINGLRWPKAAMAETSDLISIVPFGISDLLPEKNGSGIREMFSIPKEDFVAIWGGGVYEWFDPLVIIKAIAQLTSDGKKCHLVFVGIKHPNSGIGRHDMCQKAIILAKSLGLIGKFVHFNFGWVDYTKRHNYLLDADVGVSAHFNNPETRFAFRTRILDYLWCGLPVICSKGDVFGQLVASEGIGYAVDYESVNEWVIALENMILNQDARANFSLKSYNLAKNYRWNSLLSELKHTLQNIRICDDRKYIRASNDIAVNKFGFFQRLRGAYSRGGFTLIFNYSVNRILRFVGIRY